MRPMIRPLRWLPAALLLATVACAPARTEGGADSTEPANTIPAETTTVATPVAPSLVDPAPTSPASMAGPPVPAPVDVRGELAALAIDDRPNGTGYRRDMFMPGGK